MPPYLHQFFGRNRGADIVGQRGCPTDRSRGQNYAEFLAAISRRGIGALDPLGQGGADDAEHLIADGVAKFIIEGLEMVEIGHDQRLRRIGFQRGLDGLLQLPVETFPVREAG